MVNYMSDENKKHPPGGALEIYRAIALEGDGDVAPETTGHNTLCGCALSKNHPFCGGTHIRNLAPAEKN